MTCAHNCKHQPCPAPMACGVGSMKFLNVTDFEGRKLIASAPLPVIDARLIDADTAKSIASSLLYPSSDDMTYSGPFQGHGIPLYQANHDGSDPHEAPFGWVDWIRDQAINGVLVVAIWSVVAAIGIAAGYFVAKLNF